MTQLIGYVHPALPISVDQQVQTVEQYCQGQGVELLETIVETSDALSGLCRPGILEMLQRMEELGADGVVVFSVEAVSSHWSDYQELKEGHFSDKLVFHSATRMGNISRTDGQMSLDFVDNQANGQGEVRLKQLSLPW